MTTAEREALAAWDRAVAFWRIALEIRTYSTGEAYADKALDWKILARCNVGPHEAASGA